MKHITKLRVHSGGATVGELGADNRDRIYFQYDAEWLKTGFDLSPGTLPFNHELQLSPEPQEFSGLHGVFYDSLPDGWGLLLMDRAFREQAGWQNHEITPLDRLAYMGSRTMGALEYEPAMTHQDNSETIDIAQLAGSAHQVLQGETPEVLQQLQIHGGSPGGARPKVTVALSPDNEQCLSGFNRLPASYQHWLVKFRANEDPLDMGRVELAYARMAKLAGLALPECRLLQVGQDTSKDEFFAVQRFDREGNIRQHVLSLSAYIYASHRVPCIDYETVIRATYNITRSMAEAEKAFRLMVFNVLAHNKDDHSKNFAFIRRAHGWELSPVFDLTFNAGLNNQHTTDIAGSGNPRLKDVKQVAENCGIKNWQIIVEEVLTATGQWEGIARDGGVSDVEIGKIGRALGDIRGSF
uniref:HIPA PROTEIN n=1 Tax=uncultured Thiotrichaceae bacterium TaxID=298394 RepID=A0A6S6S5W7_9GAMM|nr:MAG: HIPA PROTEIN [uncultured Thiotrichaceae bacterium]